jgi:two-component system NtrC family sensor kinase
MSFNVEQEKEFHLDLSVTMIKTLLWLATLLFISTLSWAQQRADSTVFHLDSLPIRGIVLDKGWRWHAGDNPDWAKADFDDRRWASIDPTQDIMDLPQVRKAGIGWLRLHLHLDSTLVQHQAPVLRVFQAGASELYSNGQFVHRFGTIASDPNQVTGVFEYGQQVVLPATGKSTYVLAVRVAVQPRLPYNKFAHIPNFLYRIRFLDGNRQAFTTRAIQTTFTFINVGLFFILALLHFFFFLFYRPQKANLFFAISVLLYSHYWLLLGLFMTFQLTDLNSLMYFGLLRALLHPFIYIFLVTALYSAYGMPRSYFYWSSIVACGILLGIYLFNYKTGVVWIEMGSTLVMLAVALGITLVAVVRNHRGATIILIGLGLSLFGQGMRSLIEFTSFLPIPFSYGYTFETLQTLSIPIFLSIYLASEFASTSKNLAAQLAAVKQLSAQTLAQEQEKQQLLTAQNELLEQKVQHRTVQLQQSLETLKSTQTQLVQREKMASLGELTAGIAHEIQNPLNFVNNFSELSVELMDELDDEAHKGNTNEVRLLSRDIKANLTKITHHGQRASSIVKGMLEHSRTSSGTEGTHRSQRCGR